MRAAVSREIGQIAFEDLDDLRHGRVTRGVILF